MSRGLPISNLYLSVYPPKKAFHREIKNSFLPGRTSHFCPRKLSPTSLTMTFRNRTHWIILLGMALGSNDSHALPNQPAFSSSAFPPKSSSNHQPHPQPYPPSSSSLHPPEESFEERTAAWRHHQQQLQNNQTPLQQASSTDEQGRLKLLANVSKGSISFFFFVLMWRSIHHFEMADTSFAGITRMVMVLPTMILFIANMMGCVAAVSPVTPKRKKKLKLILNANKSMEIGLLVYHVLRLSIVPSKIIIREIYVGRILSNFVFLLQCQLFTKVTWDGLKVSEYYGDPSKDDDAVGGYVPGPIYDDYHPPGVYDGYENFAQQEDMERRPDYDPSYYRGDGETPPAYPQGWE